MAPRVQDPGLTWLVERLVLLGQLGELGVRISMDDFGTGYSSLAYLFSRPLPASEIRALLAASRGDPAESGAG